MWNDDYPMHDGWGAGAWVMLVVMVLLLVMLAVTVWLLLRSGSGSALVPGPASPSGLSGPARSAAEEVLAERFARGELDEDEFRRRRDVLRQ